MSGKTLLEVPYLDLLPLALRQDPDVVAFAKTVDLLWSLILPQVDNVRIWSRIDELEEPLLSNLAYQMHLEGYEGWHLAETVEQKRRLIKNAYKTHFYKGTRWSLERVFELLDIPGDVTEWWESDEGLEAFPPYTFDMDIYVNRRISNTFYFDALGLIDALKNLRSHLRRGTVHIKSEKRLNIGAATMMRSVITVYPLTPSRVEITEKTPYIGAASRMSSVITVHPRIPSLVTIRENVPHVGVASQVSSNLTVLPRIPATVTFAAQPVNLMGAAQVSQSVTVYPKYSDGE